MIGKFLRALTLRCPWCGKGPVLASWFKLRDRCGACGINLERGDEHKDDWIGALAFNLIALELIFVLGFAAVAARTWPDPPWDVLMWGSVVVLAVGGFVGYPFARLAWLAFDLTFRPPGPEEFEA